jgi:hypothetical protein
MIRLLWHRLGESADARLLRIRRLGFLRFCAIYALVFPIGHGLAAATRAASIGTTAELAHLPVEMGGWSVAGAAVATVLWFAGLRGAKLRDPSRVARADQSGGLSR